METNTEASQQTELQKIISYNYEQLVRAREKYGEDTGPNELAALFEHRMNVALGELGSLAVSHA